MDTIEPNISSNSCYSWGGHPTPESPVGLEYLPSKVISSAHLNVYVDQNKLHHPSLKSWTPASPTDLSDENPYTDMMSTSSQVLDRIKPVESESFGSAEEMCKVRDEQTSAREYSLRQTYSFLNEISSSVIQDSPPKWASPRRVHCSAKPARKISPPFDDTWSPPPVETTADLTKSSSRNALNGDARQASLNKNKLAAAKCRVNKNLQTDKLRESAHTVVTANNRLRQEVMDKMEEIQALHTEVLCHAVDHGCRDPHELRKFLCNDEGRDTLHRDDPALSSEEPHAHTGEDSTTTRKDKRTTRRRSDTPSRSCVVNHFKHGSPAHHRAERKLRTQLSEP